jgi:phage protein D
MAQHTSKHANVRVEVDDKTVFESGTSEGKLDTFSGAHITRLHVDQRLEAPDMFTVDYNLLIRSKMTFIDSLMEGQKVVIKIGYGDTAKMETIFTGEISYIEPHFSQEGHGTLTISGYDHSHRLTRGSRSKTWDDATGPSHDYATVVKQIIEKSASEGKKSDGLSVQDLSSAAGQEKFWHVPQLNVNDYMFIKSLGMDFGVKSKADKKGEKKLSFKEVSEGDVKVTVVREKLEGVNFHLAKDVRFRLSTVKQVSRVEVRGWDPGTKKNIVGVAESVTKSMAGTDGPAATAKAMYGGGKGRKLVITDHPVSSVNEAKKIAQAVFDQLAMDFVTGEAEIEGEPKLGPGDTIEFKGFGTRFDGKYLVTACQHVFIPEVLPYSCRIEFQRNATN